MTENWYIILGLEYDPNPVTDERVISEKIEEKRKYWTNESRRNPLKGAEYKKYLDLLETIKSDMIGRGNIREELINDARNRKYGPIDDALKIIQRTDLPEDIIENIAQKQNVPIDVVKKRAISLGFNIVESRISGYKAVYDEYYLKKPNGIDKYNNQIANLKVFNASSLYEFLYKDSTVEKPQNLRCDSLRQRAKERKEKEFEKKHDNISAAGLHLCSSCQECFKNESTKQQYDEYLGYLTRKQVLDDVKNNWDYTKEFSRASYDNTMGKLTEVLQDKEKAQKLMEAFCFINEIPLPSANIVFSAKEEEVKICMCGVANDISDGRKICRGCGLDLQIKCPKCGEYNDNTVSVCKCGYRIDNIIKAMNLCLQADRQIEAKSPTEAEKSVSEAQRLWPECGRIEELKKRIAELFSQREINSAQSIREAGDTEKYIYLMRELEKKNPIQANINMADVYLHDYDDAEKYPEALRCAKKLKKLGAKEGYLFTGLVYVNPAHSDFPKGKKNLKQFLNMLKKDNDRSNWPDPDEYEVEAKVRLGCAIASAIKPKTKELILARDLYKDLLSSKKLSKGLTDFLYEEANNVENLIRKNKKKTVTTIIVWVAIFLLILIVVIVAVASGLKKKVDMEKQRIRDMLENTIDEVTSESQATILEYTISKDELIEEMDYIPIDSISASSELVDSAGYVYKAENMVDMDSATSWQENESGGGEGSTITISLSENAQLRGIAFQLGSHKNEGNYRKNNRPKTLNISVNGESCDYSFDDEYCWHTILFDQPVETDSVLIELKEVYPGNLWNDTCIAEIRLIK